MRSLLRRVLKTRRGSVLAIVAVFLPATLGTMALAIDLSMLFQARLQAQRAADSAALAGASAYFDFIPAATAATPAEVRAREYAGRNDIRGTLIDPDNEVVVEVRPAVFEVYVHVHRDDIPTWFARFLGFPTGDVSADATARATPASSGKCLRPLAIPDIWDESDITQDLDDDNIWDEGENWIFEAGTGDRYAPWTENLTASPPETGYGSPFRNPVADDFHENDKGRSMWIKPQSPHEAPSSGYFYPIQLDNTAGGGATDYEEDLCAGVEGRQCGEQCDQNEVVLGQPILMERGNKVGPTDDAMTALYNAEPDAYWDASLPGGGGVVRPSCPGCDGNDSPRVIKVALFDPADAEGIAGNSGGPNSDHYVTLTNFGLFFIEDPGEGSGQVYHESIRGRFIQYAPGSGTGGGTAGTLSRVLQLID